MEGIIRSRRRKFALRNFAEDWQEALDDPGMKYNPDPEKSPTEEILDDAVPLPPSVVSQAATEVTQDALIAAAKTAQAAVPGSTLIGIEYEGWSEDWDAKVAAGDGTTYKMKISADGTNVFKGPVATAASAAKQAKRGARVTQVQFDFAHALDVVNDRYPKASVSELELDTSKGRVVWEVEFATAEGTRREVKVDVATKEIVVDQIDD